MEANLFRVFNVINLCLLPGNIIFDVEVLVCLALLRSHSHVGAYHSINRAVLIGINF